MTKIEAILWSASYAFLTLLYFSVVFDVPLMGAVIFLPLMTATNYGFHRFLKSMSRSLQTKKRP